MSLSRPPLGDPVTTPSWLKWFIEIYNIIKGYATSFTTGSLTLGTLTGALRADAGVVSVGTIRTADVTPVTANISVSHSFGTVPFIAQLEFVNLTAEQGFVAGEVMEITAAWNGTTVVPVVPWRTATTVGAITLNPASYAFMGQHKTTGAAFTPTAASWAYRFVLIK